MIYPESLIYHKSEPKLLEARRNVYIAIAISVRHLAGSDSGSDGNILYHKRLSHIILRSSSQNCDNPKKQLLDAHIRSTFNKKSKRED